MVSRRLISLFACSVILLSTVESTEEKHVVSLGNRKSILNSNNPILHEIKNTRVKPRMKKEKRYKNDSQKDKWNKKEDDEDEEGDDDEEEDDEDDEDEDEDESEEDDEYENNEDYEYEHHHHHHHWHKNQPPKSCEVQESIYETTFTVRPLDSTSTLLIPTPSPRTPFVEPDPALIDDGIVPMCYTDTILEEQLVYLQHFNGIFGSFIAVGNSSGTTYGPIAARNITASNFSFNTLATNEDYCLSASEINRYGIVADYANIGTSVNGAIAANAGSIDSIIHPSDCTYDIGDENNYLWNNITDLFSVFTDMSERFKIMQANTAFLEDTSLQGITENFNIFKLSPCSDDLCHKPVDGESFHNILKGGDDWTGPLDSYYDIFRPTLINVPVFANKNYTITSKNVNIGGGGLPACTTIFHFYPVDEDGNSVDATFNIIRDEGVEINGLIFAPQADIYDSRTGSFGGQIVTLQNFYSQGSTIKNYRSIDATCIIDNLACWPPTILQKVEYPYVYTTITLSSSVFDGTSTYSSEKTQYVDYFTNSIVAYNTIRTTSYLADTTVTTTTTVDVTATQTVVVTVVDQRPSVRVMEKVQLVTEQSVVTYTQTSTKTRYTSTSTATTTATTQGTTEATRVDTITSTQPYAPAQVETAIAVASLMFNNND